MKKRSEIQEKYKWDLSKFCASLDECHSAISVLESYAGKFASFKGKLKNRKKLLEWFELSNEFSEIADNVSMFVSANSDTDITNSEFVEIGNVLSGVFDKVSDSAVFFENELLSYGDNFLKKLINDENFKNHHLFFKELIRSRPHYLSEKEEKLLNGVSAFAGEFSQVFSVLTSANLKFNDVENEKGKKLPLTNSKYSVYMESKDRVLRKNAFTEFYKQYKGIEDTVATTFIADLKASWFYTKTSHFKSVLGTALFSDNLPQTVYKTLIKNIEEHLPLLHEYYTVKKRILGLKDFSYYDLAVPATNSNKTVTYEKAFDILKQALSVLGDDYVNLLNKSYNERWIDVYPTENKIDGAYQSGCYGKTPIVLLNYENKVDDVFTLAHELGHAMHTYYSNNTQPRELAGYAIFLAEIASTVNEIILLKHLYENAKTKREKIYYLEYYLQMFKGVLFRQTMFSQFEEYAHSLVQENKPISKTVLSNYYEELNKKYQGKSVKHHKNIALEWLRIPHFYRPFYVFKYATGITSAITIASKILNGEEGALSSYKEFLRAGGSDYPNNVLKQAGVNLESSEPYVYAFNEMKWAIDELKKLAK